MVTRPLHDSSGTVPGGPAHVAINAFHTHAERLADWLLERVFVRTDRFGGYYCKNGKTEKSARPNTGCTEKFSRELLIRHFKASQTEDVIGGYAITPGEFGVGRWVAVDIDAHDEGDNPDRNARFAVHQYHKLVEWGFAPLLLTWRSGGYHLWVFFNRDVPGTDLVAFGRMLVSDFKEFGYTKPPEIFPKQAVVPPGKFGNWLRAPGRHHTREVFASVYSGADWAEHEQAVELILSIAGDSPELIPEKSRSIGVKETREIMSPVIKPKTALKGRDKVDVFVEYNHRVSLEEVVSWHRERGHRVIGQTATRIDFSRAGKRELTESFNVQLIDGVPVTWNFSSNANLPEGKGLSPSQVRCFYSTGRYDKAAMNELAKVLRCDLGLGDIMSEKAKPIPLNNGVHLSPAAGALPPTDKSPDPQKAVAIITAYLRDRYRPDFRRGNAIHTEAGEIVPMGVACEVPTSKLIDQLAEASDTPRFQGGGVKFDSLPSFFKKWSKVAWGDLLDSLPNEDTAILGSESCAADEFRRLVREAMLSEVSLGQVIRRSKATETCIERRSIIDWCVKFAKQGPWRTIRSKQCWCKSVVLADGEIKLRVAIRYELFAQVKADRRLIEMGANAFSRRATKYGVGTSAREDRPHGVVAVVLADDFVADLTAGIVDEEIVDEEQNDIVSDYSE